MNDFEERYKKNHKPKGKAQAWWKKNRTNILRIVLFWLYYPALFLNWVDNKIEKRTVNKNQWNLQRAKEFCDEYLPKYCDYVEEENEFYFFNNGLGFSKRRVPRKYRHFVDYNKYDILRYICDGYEIDGYEKEVLNKSWEYGYEVSFKKILDKTDKV